MSFEAPARGLFFVAVKQTYGMNEKTIRMVIEGEDVEFSARPALTIIETNPLISDGQGSYTYPFSLPLTPHNNRLLGYPARFTRASKMPDERDGELWIGARMYAVTVSVTAVSAESIEVSAAVDTGTVATKFKDYMLAQFLDGEQVFENIERCIGHLSGADLSGEAYDMVENVYLSYPKEEEQRFVINTRRDGTFQTKKQDYIDGSTVSKNPVGYGIVPFLRLGWVLKKLFGQGFDTDGIYDRSQGDILIAGNTVDAIVRSTIVYSQLAPELKATDFVTAIENIRGGKFIVEGGRPRFVSFARWLSAPVVADLDGYIAGRPVVEMHKPSQIRLTQENKFTRTSIDGLSFAKDGVTQNYKGDIAGEPTYETIQQAAEVWTDMFQTLPEQEAWTQDPNYQPFYNLFMMAKTSALGGNTTRTNTVLCSNVFAYDPDVLPEKKEIGIPLTPASRTIPDGAIAVLTGANWLNTALTNAEDKKSGTKDCLCFLFKKPDGTVDIRGQFSPQTWGVNGIYKRYYTEFDMFLRHANQRITVRINKRIALDPLGKYLLFGQEVVVEQITDTVDAEYYEVVLRTARLQEPYDVEEETKQVDEAVREVVKVVSSESPACSGTTLVVTRVFRRKYIWYDGHETMDDYDSTDQVFFPQSPQCGWEPAFTLRVVFHLTNCRATGTVTTPSGPGRQFPGCRYPVRPAGAFYRVGGRRGVGRFPRPARRVLAGKRRLCPVDGKPYPGAHFRIRRHPGAMVRKRPATGVCPGRGARHHCHGEQNADL